MGKHLTLIFILLFSLILGILLFRGCHYDWNPHYLSNSAVTIDKKIYSPDSLIAVVYYTLDVGARDTRSYKSLLKEKDFDKDLMRYNLPPEIVVLNWVGNKTLNIRYDPNQIFVLGGTHSELDFNKDTLLVNGTLLVIQQRIKENRDSVFNEIFGKNK